MRFIFTEKYFYLEEGSILSEELQAWQEEFKKDKEYAWYLLGLKGCPSDADISMRFLYKVAENYFRCLTSLPELELSREKTEVLLDADTAAVLEAAVPFVIGAEYLDDRWFDSAFAILNNIFKKEIVASPNTVAMYLAEQSQQLRVPERIFSPRGKQQGRRFPFCLSRDLCNEKR